MNTKHLRNKPVEDMGLNELIPYDNLLSALERRLNTDYWYDELGPKQYDILIKIISYEQDRVAEELTIRTFEPTENKELDELINKLAERE